MVHTDDIIIQSTAPDIIIAEPNDRIGKIGSYIKFSTKVKANKPKYQWYNKYGRIPRQCKRSIIIGPIKEEDFALYRLEIRDELTGQAVFTRWAALKKAQPLPCKRRERYTQNICLNIN